MNGIQNESSDNKDNGRRKTSLQMIALILKAAMAATIIDHRNIKVALAAVAVVVVVLVKKVEVVYSSSSRSNRKSDRRC